MFVPEEAVEIRVLRRQRKSIRESHGSVSYRT